MVEEYAALTSKADTSPSGLRTLLQLADLNHALDQLEAKYWEVVLLHGLLALSQEQTATLLQVSHQAVSKRYRRGLEDIVFYINGGIEPE